MVKIIYMERKYTGIILNKYNTGETDRIYTIYTKESGKIRTLAAGIRKPSAKLAGHLEPMTLSDIFIAKKRGIGKITGAITVDNFSRTKNDLESLEKVFYALKKMEKFSAEAEGDEKTFDLAVEFLETMEEINKNNSEKESAKEIITLGFVCKLLERFGYKLEARHCVGCGGKINPGNNYFSAAKGGVLCCECHPMERNKTAISDEAVKLIRIFLKNKIRSLTKLNVSMKEAKKLKIILDEATRWILE